MKPSMAVKSGMSDSATLIGRQKKIQVNRSNLIPCEFSQNMHGAGDLTLLTKRKGQML